MERVQSRRTRGIGEKHRLRVMVVARLFSFLYGHRGDGFFFHPGGCRARDHVKELKVLGK